MYHRNSVVNSTWVDRQDRPFCDQARSLQDTNPSRMPSRARIARKNNQRGAQPLARSRRRVMEAVLLGAAALVVGAAIHGQNLPMLRGYHRCRGIVHIVCLNMWSV